VGAFRSVLKCRDLLIPALFGDNRRIVARHLAIVSPFPPAITGIGQYGYHVSRALAGSGAFERVTLLAQRPNGRTPPETREGLTVERVWQTGTITAGWQIASRLRQLSPDLVWYNLGASMFGPSPLANMTGLLSPALGRQMGLPSVATLHELLERADLRTLSAPGGPAASWGAKFVTRAATQADVVCLTLRLNLEWLAAQRPDLRLAHIPLGAYDPPKRLPEADPPELLVFTTFAPFKGLELLLGVYRNLKQDYPRLRLTMAGARHNRFPHYAPRLQAAMEDLPGARCLVDVPESDLPALFARATVVVLPYAATTGASSVIYRAAAWGRAMAASALPELTAQCRESNLRVDFFPPGDASTTRLVIGRLLAGPAARASQVEHNLRAIEQTGLQATLQAYLDTFDLALLARNGHGANPGKSGR
jgi:glycosyltransferase involved in cell wall biosynthesis